MDDRAHGARRPVERRRWGGAESIRAGNRFGAGGASIKPALLAAIVGAAALGYYVISVFDSGQWAASWLANAWREHKLFYLLIIAGANNVDNLGARIAYSLKGVKVQLAVNAWISLITFVFSSAAAFLGGVLRTWAGAAVGPAIAAALLTVLGVWMIVESLREAPATAEAVARPRDLRNDRRIGWREATLLGVALSINNIGGGLGAGVIGLDPLLLGAFSAAVSFVAFLLGNFAADWLVSKGVTRKAAIIGGVLMIAIAAKQLAV